MLLVIRFYLDFQYSKLLSVLAISSIINNHSYLMVSVVLICKDCGFYAGIIPATMQRILKALPASL